MKRNKVRCLVVDASELTKQSFLANSRASIFNLEGYFVNEVQNGQEIFESYNIPDEFQKIFIKLNSLTSYVEYEEYSLGFPFNLKIHKNEQDREKGYIKGYNNHEIYSNLMIGNNIRFKVGVNIVEEETVKEFFKKLSVLGYLPLYLQIVRDLFWEVPIETMLKISNEHVSEKQQAKIRRMKK